jgi:ferredoxin-thioredoxin reductase catalytic chain
MQKWKYCHCLLFVTKDGLPITEYLPPDHEGRQAYGLVRDPHPDKGRGMARVLEKQAEEGGAPAP